MALPAVAIPLIAKGAAALSGKGLLKAGIQIVGAVSSDQTLSLIHISEPTRPY